MKKHLLLSLLLIGFIANIFSSLSPKIAFADDWIIASQQPTGTDVTGRKWTYIQTYYKTSTSSSLSGYENYGWYWSDYDKDWTDWTSDKKSTGDNSAYEIAKTRTVYHYYRWATSKWASTGAQHNNSAGSLTKYEYLTYDKELSVKGSYTDSYRWYHDSNHNWNKDNTGSYHTVWKRTTFKTTEYRYKVRHKIYKFRKSENKESSTYPSGDNISNIQEWITYKYKQFTLDLNGWLDGQYSGGIAGYATADVCKCQVKMYNFGGLKCTISAGVINVHLIT